MSSATIILRDPLKVVKKEWVRKGQTIIPCDLNTFWDPEICRMADKYIVDSKEEHKLFEGMDTFRTAWLQSPARLEKPSREYIQGVRTANN